MKRRSDGTQPNFAGASRADPGVSANAPGVVEIATAQYDNLRIAINAPEPAGGFVSEEAALAVNAQPWEPPPGMVKRQCPECRYFFAADPDTRACGSRAILPPLQEAHVV